MPPLFTDSIPLEAEIVLKGAPILLYEDEAAHLHMEVAANGEAATGMELSFELDGAGGEAWRSGTIPLEADSRGISKTRMEISPDRLAVCRSLAVSLWRGRVLLDEFRMVFLHSRGEWPALVPLRDALIADAGPGRIEDLWHDSEAGARVLISIPREDEAEHRRMAPVRRLAEAARRRASRVVFVGDPLVPSSAKEGISSEHRGLDSLLKEHVGAERFSSASLRPEPGRFFSLAMLAACEAEMARLEAAKETPSIAVVSVGPGDARSQTPPYEFERALDAMIDRLRKRGVSRIIFVGPPPEPGRENNSGIYNLRTREAVRMHHAEMIDIHRIFADSGDLRSFYRDDTTEKSDDVLLPYPNAMGIKTLWAAIREML